MKIAIPIVLVILSFFSQLPLLSMFSWACLYLTVLLFWRENQPKVIFWGLVFFWLTIPLKLFYADLNHIPYESLSISPNIVKTTYLALLGHVVFSLGLYIAVRKMQLIDMDLAITEFRKIYNSKKVLNIYIASFFVSVFLRGVVFIIPGLSQLIGAFLQIKLAFIFLLIFSTYVNNEKKHTMILIFSIEVILSFFSIFSSFKDILITIIVSITFFKLLENKKILLNALVTAIVCMYIFFLWQSVKGEYRAYITGGKRNQEIVVGQQEALFKLWDLLKNANLTSNPRLWYSTVDRISYIEFFSQAVDNVPSYIPFERGTIWKENILHILQPRIFFPNKKSIDDSQLVNKYCTQRVAGASSGVTFSLGFLAESYIDFGRVFMYVPIFIVGWLMGFIYKKIVYQSVNVVWGFAMVTPLWFNITCSGTAGTKVLGFLIMYYIAFYLYKRYLMQRVDQYMLNDQPAFSVLASTV